MLVTDLPSRLVAQFRRFAGPFREFGVVVGLMYMVDRMLRLLSPSWGVFPYEFVVQPLPEGTFLPPALTKNVSGERVEPTSPWLGKFAAPAQTIASRFALGACGVAALRKGQLVGYAWWSREQYAEDEVRCSFVLSEPAHAVFDFDVHVMPEHRMGLGFMTVWHVFAEELRREGVQRSYSRISLFNTASLRAHVRLGSRPIGRVIFIRVGPLVLALMGRFPFLRAAFGDGRRMRFRLGIGGVV